MGRHKNTVIIIEDYPLPRPSTLYPGKIRSARATTTSLHVTIENTRVSMLGRIHEIELPLPARPADRTSRFLAAVGQDALTVGAKIDLNDIVGATVGMRFIEIGEDSQIEFARIERPPHDGTKRCTTSTRQSKDDQSKQGVPTQAAHSLPYRKDTP